jgi:hypothetical protein
VRLSSARPRLIEADVSRLADAEQLEVDAAPASIAASKAAQCASTASAGERAVEDVHPFRRDVHLREEVLHMKRWYECGLSGCIGSTHRD